MDRLLYISTARDRILNNANNTKKYNSAHRWLGSVMVRMLDLRSRGRGFDSRLVRYHVVTTWTGDCLRRGKPSR